MFKWLENRRVKAKEVAYQRGYAYAAALVLKNPKSLESVEAHVDTARTFGDHSDFDRGAEDAIRDFEELLKC
jgi:hypothetical protein